MTEARASLRAATTAGRTVVSVRAGLVVSGVFYLMVTAVLSGLWSAAADGQLIAGYSATALVWYIATAEAAVVSIPARLIEDVGHDIGTDGVTIEMLRPVRVMSLRVATVLGTVAPRLGLAMVLGSLYCTIVAGRPPLIGGVLLAVPSLLLAVCSNVIAQHVFASAAFWVDDAKGAWFLYQKLIFVLGGMLIPLEVLPSGLETVARFLPFSAMAYVPARLASGHAEPWLLAAQLGWLIVAWSAAISAFSAGQRRLVAVGS